MDPSFEHKSSQTFENMGYANAPTTFPMDNAVVPMEYSNVSAFHQEDNLNLPPQMGNSNSPLLTQAGDFNPTHFHQVSDFNVPPQMGNLVSPHSNDATPSPPPPESAYTYHRRLFQYLLSDLPFLTYLPDDLPFLASTLATYQSKHALWYSILTGLYAENNLITHMAPLDPSPSLPLTHLFNLIATSLGLTLQQLVTSLERYLSGETFYGERSAAEMSMPRLFVLRIGCDMQFVVHAKRVFPDLVINEGAHEALYRDMGFFQMRHFAQLEIEEGRDGLLVVRSFRLGPGWQSFLLDDSEGDSVSPGEYQPGILPSGA